MLFTDECREFLDGRDGLIKALIKKQDETSVRVKRQMGGGGVMFWAGIIDEKMIGPFLAKDWKKLMAKIIKNFC